jgi:hypothetical protein
MKAQIFIGSDRIGETFLSVIDESMGVLSGQVTASPEYEKYRFRIQQETESKGGANAELFPFRIVTEKGLILQAQGGITFIDSPQYDEFSVEVAGVDLLNLNV